MPWSRDNFQDLVFSYHVVLEGSNLGLSGLVAGAFSYWAISTAPKKFILKMKQCMTTKYQRLILKSLN